MSCFKLYHLFWVTWEFKCSSKTNSQPKNPFTSGYYLLMVQKYLPEACRDDWLNPDPMATTAYVPLKSQNKELLWSFCILGQTIDKTSPDSNTNYRFFARFIDSTDHQPRCAYYIWLWDHSKLRNAGSRPSQDTQTRSVLIS